MPALLDIHDESHPDRTLEQLKETDNLYVYRMNAAGLEDKDIKLSVDKTHLGEKTLKVMAQHQDAHTVRAASHPLDEHAEQAEEHDVLDDLGAATASSSLSSYSSSYSSSSDSPGHVVSRTSSSHSAAHAHPETTGKLHFHAVSHHSESDDFSQAIKLPDDADAARLAHYRKGDFLYIAVPKVQHSDDKAHADAP
jgi:HSP20 family molecular chaperone IbpA